MSRQPHSRAKAFISWMRIFLALLIVCSTTRAGEWKIAQPGWHYEFPRDHGPHRGFKTEWWYFTGNLQTKNGERFGYQLVFFRQEIVPPGRRVESASRFVVSEVGLAHFAVTDAKDGGFYFDQRLSRGAFGEAGFSTPGAQDSRLAWNGQWECRLDKAGVFYIRAETEKYALELQLQPVKKHVVHGADGVSQKSAGVGRASHYYSFTRMQSSGTLRVLKDNLTVMGESWFDHEWATNQLAAEQQGWDWFSIQFDDDTELMLFQLRRKDGTMDEYSAGTFIRADGSTQALKASEFTLTPVRWWTAVGDARYPVAWRVEVPSLHMDLSVTTPVEHQELYLAPVRYWEGMIEASGGGRTGRGYLEMTGYAGSIPGMQATE